MSFWCFYDKTSLFVIKRPGPIEFSKSTAKGSSVNRGLESRPRQILSTRWWLAHPHPQILAKCTNPNLSNLNWETGLAAVMMMRCWKMEKYTPQGGMSRKLKQQRRNMKNMRWFNGHGDDSNVCSTDTNIYFVLFKHEQTELRIWHVLKLPRTHR